MKVTSLVRKSLINSHLIALLLMIISFNLKASHNDAHDHTEEAKDFDVTAMIMHHIKDSHEFHILGEGEKSISMPLPIIIYSFKDGLLTFLSSEFHHGNVSHQGYKMGHHGIEDEQGHHAMTVLDLFSDDSHASFIDFSITRNVFSMLLSVVVILLIFLSVANAYKKRGKDTAPSGLQNLMETLIVFVRDEIAKPNIGEKKYMKFMPFLLTIFFFIWINNVLGVIPFFPGGSNLTGNIAFTLALALATMIATNVFAGTKDYWGHIFWMPGVPVPVKILLAPIELIGVFTKPFALTVRLFANITAGHIVVLSLIGLIFILKTLWVSPASVLLALFIDSMELLVAFLQAFVFTMLSSLFIGAAAEEHDHAH